MNNLWQTIFACQLYFIYFLLFRLAVLWLSSLSILFEHSVHCFTPLVLTLLKAKIKAIQICNYYKSKFSFNVLKQSNHGGAIWNGFFFFTNWSQKVQSIPHCFLKGRKPWSRCNNTRCFVQQTIQPLISAFPFLSMLHTCFWRVSHETNFRDSCPRFFNIID